MNQVQCQIIMSVLFALCIRGHATPPLISRGIRAIERTKSTCELHNSQTTTQKLGKPCLVELKLNIIKYKSPGDKQILQILRKDDGNTSTVKEKK